mmetsp:Transcript_11526/g.35040  ORF Transcript_11526/g.35040 Transcript_11526/m.35040 type:complete len:322 (-) Transcript_11526:135-1100(-)
MGQGEGRQDLLVPAAKMERSGLDANLDVVRLVLVGVDRVVHQGPRHPGQVERQSDPQVQATVDRRPPKECAPVDGQAQHRLGPVGDPLHQRIGHDEREGRGAEGLGERVQLKQDPEAERELRAEEGDRTGRGDLPRGEGSRPRPLHLGVQVPVPQVVYRAPRAAEEDRPRTEECEGPRVRWGALGRREPDRPEAGPGQEPASYGLVQPHQPGVGREGGGEAANPARRRCPALRLWLVAHAPVVPAWQVDVAGGDRPKQGPRRQERPRLEWVHGLCRRARPLVPLERKRIIFGLVCPSLQLGSEPRGPPHPPPPKGAGPRQP